MSEVKMVMSRRLSKFGRWLLLASLVACNPCPPTETDPPPAFVINIDYVTSTTPALGQEYAINWSYSVPDRVEDVFVEIQSLAFETGGYVSKYWFGCPPAQFTPEGTAPQADCAYEENVCSDPPGAFTNSCRKIQETFNFPRIVSITALDSLTNTWHRKSVTIYGRGFFRITGLALSNGGYPQLGAGVTLPIDFTNYFAVYNEDANIGVSDLSSGPITQVFDPNRPFVATSLSVNEFTSFDFSYGSQFPVLTGEFTGTPRGNPFGGVGASAAVVQASKIVLDGSYESETIKADAGLITVETVTQNLANTPGGETLFPSDVLVAQLDLAAVGPGGTVVGGAVPTLQTGTTYGMVAANARFGNRFQGLMLQTFGGALGLVPEIAQQTEALLTTPSDLTGVGVTSGRVEVAEVTWQVTTVSGDFLGPVSATLRGVVWEEVPVVGDAHLEVILPGLN